MSLKFVTRKLKTQKLEEQEQQQKKLEQVDKFKNEVVQETVLTETVIVSTLFFYKYHISSYSFRGNYSFLNLEIGANSNSCRNISIFYLIN